MAKMKKSKNYWFLAVTFFMNWKHTKNDWNRSRDKNKIIKKLFSQIVIFVLMEQILKGNLGFWWRKFGGNPKFSKSHQLWRVVTFCSVVGWKFPDAHFEATYLYCRFCYFLLIQSEKNIPSGADQNVKFRKIDIPIPTNDCDELQLGLDYSEVVLSWLYIR